MCAGSRQWSRQPTTYNCGTGGASLRPTTGGAYDLQLVEPTTYNCGTGGAYDLQLVEPMSYNDGTGMVALVEPTTYLQQWHWWSHALAATLPT